MGVLGKTLGIWQVRWVGALTFQRISSPSEALSACNRSLPSHPPCSPALGLDDRILVRHILPQPQRHFNLELMACDGRYGSRLLFFSGRMKNVSVLVPLQT